MTIPHYTPPAPPRSPAAPACPGIEHLLLGSLPPNTLALPDAVQAAIEARARHLADQAHALLREHLTRVVAARARRGHPEPVIDVQAAQAVLADSRLEHALTHVWQDTLTQQALAAQVMFSLSQRYARQMQEAAQAVRQAPAAPPAAQGELP